MDFDKRIIDCLDEAHDQPLTSQMMIKEVKSLYKEQLLDLIDEKVRNVITKFGMNPIFIPANESVSIPTQLQIVSK